MDHVITCISYPQGVVGSTAATIWYVDWHDNSTVRLVGGHGNKVYNFDWIKQPLPSIGNWSSITVKPLSGHLFT